MPVQLKHFEAKKNRRRFAADTLKCILLNENVWILIGISLKYAPWGRIDNDPALVQIMAWRRTGAKSLSFIYWHIYASLGLNELGVSFAYSRLLIVWHIFNAESMFMDIVVKRDQTTFGWIPYRASQEPHKHYRIKKIRNLLKFKLFSWYYRYPWYVWWGLKLSIDSDPFLFRYSSKTLAFENRKDYQAVFSKPVGSFDFHYFGRRLHSLPSVESCVWGLVWHPAIGCIKFVNLSINSLVPGRFKKKFR